MSSNAPPSHTALPTAETGLTPGELFGVLTERQRRRVLHALHGRDGATDRESLAAAITGDDESERRTAVELHHLVLPRLDQADLVRLSDDGDVALTDSGRSVTEWLESVAPR
jgi:hypothetical protein